MKFQEDSLRRLMLCRMTFMVLFDHPNSDILTLGREGNSVMRTFEQGEVSVLSQRSSFCSKNTTEESNKSYWNCFIQTFSSIYPLSSSLAPRIFFRYQKSFLTFSSRKVDFPSPSLYLQSSIIIPQNLIVEGLVSSISLTSAVTGLSFLKAGRGWKKVGEQG